MSDAKLILAATRLHKTYASYELGPLDLHLYAGDTVALLGPNGAGKTTLFQLLTGMTDPNAGTIHLLGKQLTPDTPETKRQLGYLPQNHYLPRWVTGAAILQYGASLYGFDAPAERYQRVSAAMDYWDCAAYSHKPLATCSHGMKKRVALALATLHEPAALFLDEPYSGLDLYHIRALDQVIDDRRGREQATILSTHVAPYAAQHCNRALILQAGQLRELTNWKTATDVQRLKLIDDAFFSTNSSVQVRGQA